MKSNYLSILAITVAAFGASQAMAAGTADTSAPLTRAQVQAELAQAQRSGDIVVDYETGRKANEVFPDRYPAKAVVQGKTRAQVQAELAEAIRTGNMPADGVTGLMLNQVVPGNYPAPVAAQGKTRAQVQAELIKAIHDGTLPVHDNV